MYAKENHGTQDQILEWSPSEYPAWCLTSIQQAETFDILAKYWATPEELELERYKFKFEAFVEADNEGNFCMG
jgi:hypothetical protein